MTKKIISNIIVFLLVINCSLFLIWYLGIAYYDVFSLDDYWHGANYHIYGFWGSQEYYYNNWEGSYSHTFFATIIHHSLLQKNFGISSFPFILFSFLLVNSAVYFFLKAVFKSDSLLKLILVTLFCSSIIYGLSSGKGELNYWTCANVTYLTGLAFSLFYFIILFNKKEKFSIWDIGLMLLLSVLIIGNKISLSIYFFALNIFFALAQWRSLNQSKKKTFYFLIILALGLLMVNTLAPGNYVRLNENENSPYIGFSLFEVISERFTNIVLPAFFNGLILVLPLSILFSESKKKIETKFIYYFTVIYVLIFLAESIIFWKIFKDPGPVRSNIFLEFLTYIFVYLSLYKFVNQMSLIKKNISLVSLIGLICFQSSLFKYFDESRKFSVAANNRYVKVMNSPKDVIFLDRLPKSGLLHDVGSNDEIWLNYVYLKYFYKSPNTRIIVGPNDIKN